ncbi:DNA polymerase I [Aeoliella sp. SH292]|uniref:DNA polymerase I n=1 Tax=Aeoliella sp. SH292 TaxID=3454464 RepID=UPI003F9AB425
MRQQQLPGHEDPTPDARPTSAPEGPQPGETVYVIDSHSLIFQVFHAIPEMTSPRGEPVSAVFGFLRDLLFLLQDRKPDYLFAAFDMPGPTFRHDLYDGYKADRGEMPEALSSQIPKIETMLDALAIPVIGKPGYEADDVLATLARECDERGVRCLLVTGDKDCRQLITQNVSVYNIRKNEEFGSAELFGDWGVRPDQVVDFQSLVGDKIDNVPGVPLIGPKIAKELLETYGTLDDVLAAAPTMKPGKRRENLIAHAEDARMSRDLVRLDAHVPIDIDWQTARPGGYEGARIAQLCGEFGFRALGERAVQMADNAPQPTHKLDANYEVVTTFERLEMLVDEMMRADRLSVDTETTAINPRAAKLVGLSLAWEPGTAYYVPVRAPAGDPQLDEQRVLDVLRPVLENPAIPKVGQNLKYDMIVLRGAGLQLKGLDFDTMVASYLLDAGERTHNMDVLAKRYLNHETVTIDTLIGKGKNQKRMDQVPVAQIGHYAAEDADIPLRLVPILEDRLKTDDLEELNSTLEVPLIEVLAELEYNGIRVDVARLSELSKEFGDRLQTLEEEIEDLAGHPFNIASPKQLAEVLFTELKLPVLKKTKTGPSTDASVLEELASQHPLPAKIMEHRGYAKLKGTYVDALPEMVHPETGRVHASFNQVVAATGRLSSSDPNLQNIPIRTEVGREIRSAFTSGQPGWKLLAADYSQIELRVLAHFSEDSTLCEAFATGQDIHTLVASQVAGVGLDEVTSDMRRSAKAVNFGIIYGQSPFGLAKSLGISKDEAARFICEYFARYPGVEDFMQGTLADCRRDGFVKTLLGRRRAISGIRPPTKPKDAMFDDRPQPMQLNLPERTAVNTVIQGTAADLIKLAMLAIHRRMKAEQLQAKMILQIHDELVFDVPDAELDTLRALVVEEMAGVYELRVPLGVDVKTGENWAKCE